MEALFRMLADDRPAADAELPHTGVTVEWERLLSSPFIRAPHYGTRCSTVLLIARDGNARLVERSFDADGAATGDVQYEFTLESTPVAGRRPQTLQRRA